MGHNVSTDKFVEIKALVHKDTEWIVLRRRTQGTFAIWGEGTTLNEAESDFWITEDKIHGANLYATKQEMWHRE